MCFCVMIPRFWSVWILFLVFVIHCSSNNLVKVIILFRHGARTPLFPYQFHGNADDDEKFWPEGYGQLIQSGKKQLFDLGSKLRKRYEDFLIPHSNSIHADVRAVTTDSERCYQSAGFLLAGLYPPSSKQMWSEELNWQPVPILFKSADRIKIIGNRQLCPVYNDDLQNVEMQANNSDPDIYYLLKFFSTHITSAEMNNPTDLFFVADYFNTKKAMNLSLPGWIPSNVFLKLNRFYINSFDYLTSTFRMRRLLAGLLIKDIILRIDEVVYRKSSNSKFFLYSGHDSSLHSLGAILGIEFASVPYFGASIIFEVYNLSTNDFRIKILYSPDFSLEKLEVWNVPGCEELCPVKKFIALTERFITQDWEKECGTPSNKL